LLNKVKRIIRDWYAPDGGSFHGL